MGSSGLRVQTLASGSSGNATFVAFGDTRLLLDAGISCRRISAGLEAIGERLDALDAVLITHSHGDHVAALETLRNQAPHVPIFASRGTRTILLRRELDGIGVIDKGRPTQLGDVTITAFPVSHDAPDPVGYRLESSSHAMAIATDLGEFDHRVRHALRDVQLLILEANHCRQMLADGPYPPRLKRRVASRRGHLSNDQARLLLREVAGPRLERVILCHLSAQNNAPLNALAAVTPAVDLQRVPVTAAPRESAGPLYEFGPSVASGRGSAPPLPARQIALPFAAA